VGLNPNPELHSRCERFLAGRPRQGQYTKRTEAELTADVNRLTDLVVELVRERDWLLVEAQGLKSWVCVLRWAVVAEAAIIGWFATELFSRLK
jgi:hypothetical protein